MSESPVKKKAKLAIINKAKRALVCEPSCDGTKRHKEHENIYEAVAPKPSDQLWPEEHKENYESLVVRIKKKNFIKACDQVSYDAYYDHRRFMLFHASSNCINGHCKHHDAIEPQVIPIHLEETFRIEYDTGMWCEALEIVQMCITPKIYPTVEILKNVVEIILNAHEDIYSGYSIPYLLDRSKIILSSMFRKHPPCTSKKIRRMYVQFLTSPMGNKVDSYSNRTEFSSDNGIIKYCLTRLSCELDSNAEDMPIVKKGMCDSPEIMTVRDLSLQKKKFELYEALPRTERIDRLLIVLEVVVELLQMDLEIWHSRYTGIKRPTVIMKPQRPLIASLLWEDKVLYTGSVNKNCIQIMQLFINFVCLGYPEHHIKTMTIWLNTIIQTFYICESNSTKDYPNTGKYCMNFASEFHKLIKDLPKDLMLKVLTYLQPTYMRYILGLKCIMEILNTREDDILMIIKDFLINSSWIKFTGKQTQKVIEAPSKNTQTSVNKLFPYLAKFCKKISSAGMEGRENKEVSYPKYIPYHTDHMNQTQVICLLYITFEAYLDAFSVEKVQNTLDGMNENSIKTLSQIRNSMLNDSSVRNSERNKPYSVSETFIKKYRTIYLLLKEVMIIFSQLKAENKLCDDFKIFEKYLVLE